MARSFEDISHPFEPVYDGSSRVLVLGSFPSVASREQSFYYGHPQNRFWRVAAALCKRPVPQTTDEKLLLLHENRIALWDVISVCDITGSSDASIRNARPNDIAWLVSRAPIEKILLNGRRAGELYAKLTGASVSLPYAVLPSTSPANASWSLQRLLEAWAQLADARH